MTASRSRPKGRRLQHNGLPVVVLPRPAERFVIRRCIAHNRNNNNNEDKLGNDSRIYTQFACKSSRCGVGEAGAQREQSGRAVQYLDPTTASRLRFIVAQQQGSIDVASLLNCCQFKGILNTKATGKWPESNILSLEYKLS